MCLTHCSRSTQNRTGLSEFHSLGSSITEATRTQPCRFLGNNIEALCYLKGRGNSCRSLICDRYFMGQINFTSASSKYLIGSRMLIKLHVSHCPVSVHNNEEPIPCNNPSVIVSTIKQYCTSWHWENAERISTFSSQVTKCLVTLFELMQKGGIKKNSCFAFMVVCLAPISNRLNIYI